MIKRAPRPPRNRTRLPSNFQPAAPALTWTATIVAGKVRIVTNTPYSYSGVPTGITVQGVGATSITTVTATSFDLGYAATPVSTNTLVVPANVSQVRGQAGGTLATGSFTFP